MVGSIILALTKPFFTSNSWSERMPIYEYLCKSCGKSFETMQKMSEPPVAPCPKCGDTADRMISRTSFSLKGSGWYKDGYSKSSVKKDNGKKSPEKKTDAKATK
jgi:putative FmdB family regulatory protein